MSTYNPLVPTGTIPLNLDYKNLQKNFNQMDITYGVDHVPLTDTTNKNGYHKTIHSVPFSTAGVAPANATNQPVVSPTTVPSIGQIFTAIINDGFNTDTALYLKTGGGRTLQLTTNKTPVAANNGYTFLPGGVFIQWGQITDVTSTPYQPLLFATANVDFANNCFAVFAQCYGNGTPPSSHEQATISIDKSTVSKTGFEWTYETNSGTYTGFYWVAIGN